ncbi:SPOR domain-containing protein [Sulfurovum sp.]|uniref:SPOR domain-containing protein n=1 Tax=Sulfurovum sp. TaxID=1969726 RepID=UPI002867BB61|nr:SPOR domain-containing protein [Sulfurovum sp.]
MFRLIIISLLFLSNSFGSSYQVQLGSFGNYDALIASISKIEDESYKSKISIEQEGEIYNVYSRVYEKQSEVQSALHAYREVFKDAFIREDGVDTRTKDSVIEAVQEERSVSESSLWQSVRSKPPVLDEPAKEIPIKQGKLSFSEELKRKIFYLCYEGNTKGTAKPVVKAVFNQKFITYSSEMMEIPPIVTQYKLINNDLHVTVGMFSVGSTRSRLESVTNKYLRTVNWADGKKVQPVRFYFNKSDAVAFMQRDQPRH